MEFGDWIVVKFSHINKQNRAYWICRCRLCDTEKPISSSSLIRGDSTKCRKCATRLSHTMEYSHDPVKIIFKGMKQRCYNPNTHSYKNYGARGITICDEWLNNPNSFYMWAYDNGYSQGLSIERIDVSMGYYPENCKFISKSDQSKNKTNTIMITIDGETKCLADWAKLYNINYNTVRMRIKNYHMNPIEALTKPTHYK